MSFVLICRYSFYCVLAVVTVLAFMPPEEVSVSTGWDKANHCLAFAVLLVLLDHAYPKMALWGRKCSLLLVYGIFIEVVQSFLSWREFSWWDIVADSVGLLLYWVVRPLIINNIPFIRHKDFTH